MRSLIPRKFRWIGLGGIPRLAMYELLGAEAMRRVGIEPPSAQGFQRWFFHALLRLVHKPEGSLGEHFIGHVGFLVFQGMIDVSRGGEVRFIVPEDLEMVRERL